MVVLEKIFTRQFPLLMFQVWGNSFENFMGREIKLFPKQITFFTNGFGLVYRNNALAGKINDIFLEELEKNPAFFDKLYENSLKGFAELKKSTAKETISKEELLAFLDQLEKYWPAVYAAPFVPIHKDLYPKKATEKMMALRKQIAPLAYNGSELIRRSLKKIFPKENPENISFEYIQGKMQLLEKTYVVDGKLCESIDDLIKKYNIQLKEPEKEPTQPSSKIVGQIAYPGKTTGKAFILTDKKKLHMFKEKAILVCHTVYPDYFPIINKATAIVADEGGITSHAAIFAREFKIPTIIGVHGATKIFKNEDNLEVDANQGIVRKVQDKGAKKE